MTHTTARRPLPPLASAPRGTRLNAVRIAIIRFPWVPVPPPAYGGTETVLDGLIRVWSRPATR